MRKFVVTQNQDQLQRMPKTVLLTTPIDDERPVYLAGDFCKWYPDAEAFKMQKIAMGQYQFTFPESFLVNSEIEYKYTRGSWDAVELNAYGEGTANRKLKNDAQLNDFVPYWRIKGAAFDAKLMPRIVTINDFEIPQLKRKRRVFVLLPHNYEATTKRYPVVYMQDGQNLFGDGSEYGNWEIDKKMAILAARGIGDFIVVTIDHGDKDRFLEYSPYSTPAQGKGLGQKYANFIIRTLKPYIDKNYRTKPEREFTGVGGSSMGGLVSIYAGLMYPETLGRLMVFSPSLWVSQKIYFDAIEFFNPMATKIYLYAGAKEGKYMIPSVERLKDALEKQGYEKARLEFNLSTDRQGKHNEARWSQEFPRAIEWLFFSQS